MARTAKQRAALKKAQTASALKRARSKGKAHAAYANIAAQSKHYAQHGPPKGLKVPHIDSVSAPKSGIKKPQQHIKPKPVAGDTDWMKWKRGWGMGAG